MKVAAHPLVVAVAMGLLGPGALEEEAEASESSQPCTDCGEVEGLGELASVETTEGEHLVTVPSDEQVDVWLERPTPTPEAQARALAEYLAVS